MCLYTMSISLVPELSRPFKFERFPVLAFDRLNMRSDSTLYTLNTTLCEITGSSRIYSGCDVQSSGTFANKTRTTNLNLSPLIMQLCEFYVLFIICERYFSGSLLITGVRILAAITGTAFSEINVESSENLIGRVSALMEMYFSQIMFRYFFFHELQFVKCY